MSYKLLIVDDDPISLEAIRSLLQKRGHQVETARSGDEAIRKVSAAPDQYGLLVLDYRMEGKNGAQTAREILSITRDLFVLMHSGDDSRDALQDTWEAGAVKFIEKNRGAEYFLETVEHWCREYETRVQPLQRLSDPGEDEALIRAIGMVGRSPGIAGIARRLRKYQEERSDLSVLILGENGSGKELVARAVHQFSARNRHPFVAVDAGAIAENLIESELFGHERGAFTGADRQRVGCFQAADKGTLFLDEIGNTSAAVQAKLLRAIQQRVIRPVGSSREVPVDVRIVAATNLDLRQAIREGKFREDLYYRLKGITLAVPPLRERPEDIEPLIHYLCEKYNRTRGKQKSFLMRTVRLMERYPWPGNVRELEHTVMQLLTESYTDKITPEHLAEVLPLDTPAPVADKASLKDYLDEVTRNYVLSLLRTSRSKLEAAQRAGMAETTFRDLLKRLGLQQQSAGGASEDR